MLRPERSPFAVPEIADRLVSAVAAGAVRPAVGAVGSTTKFTMSWPATDGTLVLPDLLPRESKVSSVARVSSWYCVSAASQVTWVE